MTDVSELYSYDCHRLFNLAPDVLRTYFSADTAASKSKLRFRDGIIELDGHTSRSNKVFIYGNADLSVLQQLQKKATLFTAQPFELEGGVEFHDLVYDLDKIWDRGCYSSSKRFGERVNYPLNWVRNHGVKVIHVADADKEELLRCHDAWLEHKLADPTVFQRFFPKVRYKNCLEFCTTKPSASRGFFDTHTQKTNHSDGLAFEFEGKIEAVEIFSVHGDTAYMLARFGTPTCHPKLRKSVVMPVLEHLKSIGVRYYNQGSMSLNANSKQFERLEAFKAHYPHDLLPSFKYPRIQS